MAVQSKLRAFMKMIATKAPQKNCQNFPGPEVTRSSHLINATRALIFGRGRRKRFYVLPTIRQARKLFRKYPLTSNSLFYGALFVAAEFMQQTWKQGHRFSTSDPKITTQLDSKQPHTRYDLGSFKRYAVWGTLVVPPIYQQWYNWLDAKFHLCEIGPLNRKVLAQKMVLDQFVLTPVILVFFFVAMNAMEGKSDLLEECKHKFWKTFAADCCFWLPVQALNFVYVPSDLRVAFIAITTFVWLNVLCWFKSLPIKGDQIEDIDASLMGQVTLKNQVSVVAVEEKSKKL